MKLLAYEIINPPYTDRFELTEFVDIEDLIDALKYIERIRCLKPHGESIIKIEVTSSYSDKNEYNKALIDNLTITPNLPMLVSHYYFTDLKNLLTAFR